MTKITLLNDAFTPSNYNLHITIDRDKSTFSGTVEITGKLHQDASAIVLHAKNLDIQSAVIGEEPCVVALTKQDDLLTITAAKTLQDAQTVLVSFSGKITEQMHGIYPSTFNHDGETKTLISTQFESHHAREAFPCIDEPAAKATFDVSLSCPETETVIANTKVKQTSKKNNIQTITFETTPIMSTYLLAFAIGEFTALEAKTKHGVMVRTYATPNNTKHTKFALDTAVKCLDFYDDYFETPFPLDKLDMIAIPDFAAGAMENWGLVTYRESALLVDPENTSLANKQWVAMVVAHELAHQWFGNLVTMEWWTDLWLNEGFASWVEYLAVDHIYPEWNMWVQFITDDFIRAQNLDALASSHPIEVPIDHPDDIRGIFDAISYSKGASAIRMLQAYLGPEPFRKGLAHYLKTHAYGNAATNDLWSALESTTGKPVQSFMKQWTQKTGYPVVSAVVGDDAVSLTQERYFVSPIEKEKNSEATLWPIPINSDSTDDELLFDTKEAIWKTALSRQPLKLNKEQSGFYMVRYNTDHLASLARSISENTMSVTNRLGLLSDYFALMKSGNVKSIETLSLLSSYKNEDDATVWDIIADIIGSIRGVMDDETLRELMKPYLRELVAPQLKRLGFTPLDSDTHSDRLLRPTILGIASSAETPAVLSWAHEQFSTMEKPSDIPVDVRGIVYATTAREEGKAAFDKLWSLYTSTDSAQEKGRLTGGLTNFKQSEIIDQVLGLIKTKDVRLQEISYWVAYSFMNRHAKDQAWDWLKENWSWIKDTFGSDIMTFASFAKYPASTGNTFAFAEAHHAFFSSVNTDGIQRQVDQAEEVIRWHAAWRERDLAELITYFKQQKG